MKVLLPSVLLMLVLGAQAKNPSKSQSGTLLQMESVSCGADEKSAKSITGEILGTDSAHKKTYELLCQEYLLQSDRVIYRIRPKDEKHPVLLPVGEKAQFHIEKDKMKLRVEDLDDKERDYFVVSMTRRDTNAISTASK